MWMMLKKIINTDINKKISKIFSKGHRKLIKFGLHHVSTLADLIHIILSINISSTYVYHYTALIISECLLY